MKDQVLVIVSDAAAGSVFERVFSALNVQIMVCKDSDSAREILKTHTPALVICSENIPGKNDANLSSELLHDLRSIPHILLADEPSSEVYKTAIRSGYSDCVTRPLRMEDVRSAVQGTLERARQRKEDNVLETQHITTSLQRRVDELETLQRLGISITSSLDMDSVLTTIVTAAVELTGAEEGSLMLLDETTGELYMRAARNYQEDFVRTFRLPVQDSVISSVLSAAHPVILDEQTPQKIKTSYLVQSLVYVPLQIKGRVFGVLGVDNRVQRKSFTEQDIVVLSAIAEYAVIAIQNAALYTSIVQDRNKLETILTGIQDGVIILDQDQRLALVNNAVRSAFDFRDQRLIGRPFADVFNDPDMIRMVEKAGESLSYRMELNTPDGRVFSAHVSPISKVGAAITLHDITNLKKLDRIICDYLSAVSHDLRSPLTAILGYVELIERAGPINDRQRDFIRGVHTHVDNITRVMDDLLHLGNIESGFDANKELVSISQLVQNSLDGFTRQMAEKKLAVRCNLPDQTPPLLANPVQMRQMLDKILHNAIQYTPPGGEINIRSRVEQDQMILEIHDTGAGISALDMPYIFDKFYRGSQAMNLAGGTGLGLAIVKSIVETHHGRIWVDSPLEKGTTFTVVLPLAEFNQ
ncbi:MAG TPA: ATP-binding protein [Levilinea sp.]|nr:ATP-binding protein [Levilinea sp.]